MSVTMIRWIGVSAICFGGLLAAQPSSVETQLRGQRVLHRAIVYQLVIHGIVKLDDVPLAFERMRQHGRDDLLREDIAMRKAVDLLVENATPISVEQAKARDKLWTPEKEKQEGASEQIWTPGS